MALARRPDGTQEWRCDRCGALLGIVGILGRKVEMIGKIKAIFGDHQVEAECTRTGCAAYNVLTLPVP